MFLSDNNCFSLAQQWDLGVALWLSFVVAVADLLLLTLSLPMAELTRQDVSCDSEMLNSLIDPVTQAVGE